jgi:hypothetical protein
MDPVAQSKRGASNGGGPTPSSKPNGVPEWEVGNCVARAQDAPDSFELVECEDDSAVAKVIAKTHSDLLENEPACPPGTDVIVNVERTFGAACLRNLSDPHPGDPGMGGGQLFAGDCIALRGRDIQETRCDASGSTAPQYRVVGLTKNSGDCPPETSDVLELTLSIGQRRYSVICAQSLE